MDNFRCPLESLMLANHEPDWNIDDLSDTEVYAAIRYLERDPGSTNEQDDDRCVIICAACMSYCWCALGSSGCTRHETRFW